MIFNKLALFSIFLTIASISVTPYPEMLVISYILHELGHMLFARVVGAKMKKIKISRCILYIILCMYTVVQLYPLLWLIFICLGLLACVAYGFLYKPDRKTFPKLYEK